MSGKIVKTALIFPVRNIGRMKKKEKRGIRVVEDEPPNYRNQESCGLCHQCGQYSNFQDAWCKKFKKKVEITKVCDKFE